MTLLHLSQTSMFVDIQRSLAALALGVCACSAPTDEPQAQANSVDEKTAVATDEAAPSALPPQPDPLPVESPAREPAIELHPKLANYVVGVTGELGAVPVDRREQLEKLASFVENKRNSDEVAKITFICTHNSRRSHLSQLWAAVAAAYYGIDGVETYSGGTESTAFNPRAVAALRRAGFEISTSDENADNPRYQVTYAKEAPALEAFSKKYGDPPNPSGEFAAVMTCSQADKSCPIVYGAELRVPVPYVDPKVSDGTPEESVTYDERTRQIATEMFYLFSKVRV